MPSIEHMPGDLLHWNRSGSGISGDEGVTLGGLPTISTIVSPPSPNHLRDISKGCHEPDWVHRDMETELAQNESMTVDRRCTRR